ncbi:hypothetical protein AA0535_1955 [Asaia krungthepensis NRIC 0535]|uniref:Uncharacterized protein n=1 Tax=Asaia krungthepensis NRIC 0535 TaxID=1307925 RepID=A0ABQ0Q3T7_9PROT|nr:hypothetical protein AA0535_1955 [Asaia krungthepensis NRIC 0535]
MLYDIERDENASAREAIRAVRAGTIPLRSYDDTPIDKILAGSRSGAARPQSVPSNQYVKGLGLRPECFARSEPVWKLTDGHFCL